MTTKQEVEKIVGVVVLDSSMGSWAVQQFLSLFRKKLEDALKEMPNINNVLSENEKIVLGLYHTGCRKPIEKLLEELK